MKRNLIFVKLKNSIYDWSSEGILIYPIACKLQPTMARLHYDDMGDSLLAFEISLPRTSVNRSWRLEINASDMCAQKH